VAKDVVTALYLEAQKKVDGPVKDALIKHALKSESENSLTSMIELFKSEPGIAIYVKELDTYGDIFPAKNGPVDLKTGQLLEAQQGMYGRSVMLASGHFACWMTTWGSLVPWKLVIEQRLGQAMTAIVRGNGVSLEFGRQRGPSIA
jgi:hypothetical protein